MCFIRINTQKVLRKCSRNCSGITSASSFYFPFLIRAYKNLLEPHITFPQILCFSVLFSLLSFTILFELVVCLFPLRTPTYCGILPHAGDNLSFSNYQKTFLFLFGFFFKNKISFSLSLRLFSYLVVIYSEVVCLL